MTWNKFAKLEIKETSQEGKELFHVIRDSLCSICLKEFTAKDIRNNNYLLSFFASCNEEKFSFYSLSLYVEHINHKTCLPNKYQLEEREKWIKSYY